MISALSWTKRGYAKRNPDRFELSEEEYQKICEMTRNNLSLAKSDYQEALNEADKDADNDISEKNDSSRTKEDEEMAEYNLDNYDEEETAGILAISD